MISTTLLFCFVLGVLNSPVFAYQRGRVGIKNNTLYTDQNTLLRFVDFQLWNPGEECSDKEFVKSIRDLGFNSMRLSVIFDSRWQSNRSIDSKLTDIAKRIQNTRELGMYCCIDYHDVGGYTLSHLKEFWNKVAHLYKDKTHVLYELANEPVAWTPEKYTSQNLQYQQDVYQLIRTSAPNTHIIMLSYATATSKMTEVTRKLNGIDWSNASVGFHPYHCSSNMANLRALRSEFPCVNTEFEIPENNVSMCREGISGEKYIIKLMEEEGFSWFFWTNGSSQRSYRHARTAIQNAKDRGYMLAFDKWDKPSDPTKPTPDANLDPNFDPLAIASQNED